MKLLFPLIQVVSFFLLVAYVYCKSPAYRLRRSEALGGGQKIALFLFFALISIGGTYMGVKVQGAIANARAIGPVLAGLIGGPALGLGVGLVSGLHRYSLGGFTALACGLSTTVEGLIGGLAGLVLRRSASHERALSPLTAGLTMLLAEVVQMAIILAVARPFADAWALVRVIGLPMILANSCGAALFMSILRDRLNIYDLAGNASTARTLRIADRTLELLAKGFSPSVAPQLAAIIQEELAHVNAYLEIEKARFEEQLTVRIEVDPQLLQLKGPTFTLQPLIENAIKHGIAEMLEPGTALIRIYRDGACARIDIEDNAGNYKAGPAGAGGLGMSIVDRRIRSLLKGRGLSVHCEPDVLTRVSFEIPVAQGAA